MLVPIHRAVSAVLHVLLVTFVTLSARAQHGVLRSKHWLATAAVTAATVATLVGPYKYIWSSPQKYIW
jgi:hypothetical protein